MGSAFAHHFASYDATAAMTNYAGRFQAVPQNPHGILAVAAVAAETEIRKPTASSSMEPRPAPRPRPILAAEREEALAYNSRTASAPRSCANRSRLFVGGPATLMAKLQPDGATASQPDELMIVAAVYDHEARENSYSLLADAFGLAKKVAA